MAYEGHHEMWEQRGREEALSCLHQYLGRWWFFSPKWPSLEQGKWGQYANTEMSIRQWKGDVDSELDIEV